MAGAQPCRCETSNVLDPDGKSHNPAIHLLLGPYGEPLGKVAEEVPEPKQCERTIIQIRAKRSQRLVAAL